MKNHNEKIGNPYCSRINEQLHAELGLGKGYDFKLLFKLDEQFRMQLHDKLHNQLCWQLEEQLKLQMENGKFK